MKRASGPAAGAPPSAASALSVDEEARWLVRDLVSRRGRAAAPDLLRGHSAELAGSPATRDRALGLALDKAAEELESGGAAPPDPSAPCDLALGIAWPPRPEGRGRAWLSRLLKRLKA